MVPPVRTNVYVDGFNLYYGMLKGRPDRKWLDLRRLAETLAPKSSNAVINTVRYFTAMVTARPDDPQEPARQLVYLRALRASNVEVHLGQFRAHKVWMHLVAPPSNGSPYAHVIRTDEKGSDVNLATYLLCDAYEKGFDQALVISNDSDLATPVRIVTSKLHLRVLVFSPYKGPTAALQHAASGCRELRDSQIISSQFPPEITDAKGKITKPPHW
jgi:hypothetical protein